MNRQSDAWEFTFMVLWVGMALIMLAAMAYACACAVLRWC
jgi:hypothetical protein